MKQEADAQIEAAWLKVTTEIDPLNEKEPLPALWDLSDQFIETESRTILEDRILLSMAANLELIKSKSNEGMSPDVMMVSREMKF